MGDLSVLVRLHGTIVENRVLPVAGLVRLGESPAADVPFPGADLTVTRSADGLHIRGRVLAEGDTLTVQLGKVEVTLEHTLHAPMPREWGGHFDGRFLMVLLLVAVSAAWVEAFERWATVHLPAARGYQAVQQLARSILPPPAAATQRPDPSRAAAVAPAESIAAPPRPGPIEAVGPRHRPDDRSSGIRWYRWYRGDVPTDSEQLDAAVAAHLVDPYDADARRVLGQSAYDSDHFADATDQFAFIVEHYPSDPDARARLARSEMRLGHHHSEIHQYRAILRQAPEDVHARAGLAVALTRLERLDEAARHIDELRLEHPDHPITLLAEAKLAALAGQDRLALVHLDDVMHTRSTMSASDQLELRRDIALDPAFARLRKDVRLRSVIHRHVGAAGPRPIR